MVIIAIFIIRLFVRDLFGLNKPQPVPTNTPQAISSTKPRPVPSTSPASPTPIPSPSPTATPKASYDSSYGNNYIAAREAKDFLDVMNGAVPGFITNIYLELSPTDVDQAESEYIQSVSSIFLQVQVNSTKWYAMNEGQQKDVVTAMTTSIQKAVGNGYPHVYVSNGARTVAEGIFSLIGEPKVEIK